MQKCPRKVGRLSAVMHQMWIGKQNSKTARHLCKSADRLRANQTTFVFYVRTLELSVKVVLVLFDSVLLLEKKLWLRWRALCKGKKRGAYSRGWS